MTLQQIYQLALDMGIKADPRGASGVKKMLARVKKEYDEMPEKKKKNFNKEWLSNPYSDTHVLYGDPETVVKKVLAGIDADGTEILLADRLNEKGKKIDAVISHHPAGHALVNLYEVMDIQVDIFKDIGVPENVAHALMEERMGYVKRRFSPMNHNQVVDTARLLDMPLVSIHTVWDNLGHQFLNKYLSKKEFDTVGELLDYITEIPEFQEAARSKAGPSIISGSPKRRAGKIFATFTGGTNPSKELFKEMAKSGVGTIVDMHMPEESLEELKKLHINIIDTGHMASDSIGANLYLDELEKRGIEVIPCSGLIRVRRYK